MEQHLRLGVKGLFLAGSCGEGPYMTNSQRVELVRQVKRLSGKRLHIAAQVSDTSALRVRENIARMQEAGADTVVLAPPWISRFSSADFLRRYFFEAIELAEAPVGVYILRTPDIPALDQALWTEIISHPKVGLVKDSSASDEYIRLLMELKSAKRPELKVLTGYEFDVLKAAAAGYNGALLGTGILNAGLLRRALEALTSGDKEAAAAWQKRSNELLWDLFRRDLTAWLGGLKYALVRLGIFATEFMHLSFPLAEADRVRIDRALERERALIRPALG